MFGRAPTLRYIARLTGATSDAESIVLSEAEETLGLEKGSLERLMRDTPPS